MAWMSFARYYYVCVIKQQCPNELVEEKTSPPAQTLELRYQDSVLLKGYDEFRFPSKSAEPTLTKNNNSFLDSVANYLHQNPEWQLTIGGKYLRSEIGLVTKFHENLGQARADSIRNLLLDRGADENIALDFSIVDEEQLGRPISFTFSNPTQIPEAYEKVLFTFHNMTFSDANFEYDSDVFKPDQPLINYADSVKTYLGERPNQQFTIIGHTDADGTKAYNRDLGLRRAKAAREYFKNLGIANTIKVETKGEEAPMAPNDNEENKQKNRRVNFQIE